MAWEEGDDLNYTSPGVPHRDVKWYRLEDVDSRAKWFTAILLLVSVGMLIAGSVMLGIGISKNNNSCPVNPSQTTGYTMFLTVRTKALPYSSVVNNYSGSVQNLTDQMRQVISGSSSAAMKLDTQPNVPITILGISNAGVFADVMYALSYTDANKQSLGDVQNKVTASTSFSLVAAIDKTPPALTQMTCTAVADNIWTTTTGPSSGTTQGQPGTTSQSVTTSPCVPITVPTVATSPGTPGSSPASPASPASPGTTASPVPGASTLTPPTPIVTQPARTTTTAFVKTPYSKDVIILLDDSTAVKKAKNFNMLKSWITKTLLPLWLIDREDVQVAFATFADREFDMLLDFDESDENEVASVISSQIYNGKYNSSITNGIRAAGGVHGLRPVNQTVIFISASEDLTDIESATNYAFLINTLPKQLITITVNSATNGKQLGLLSTNQNHFFGVPDFNLTSDIAQQLTQYMFGTLTPTTVAPTTTGVPDNACKTDATILLDNNNDVGSAAEYMNELRTITKLIKTWPVSSDLMEGEAIVFSTTEGGQIIENPFAYQSASTFANEVMAYDDFYFVNSPPSLSASLQFLSKNLYTRRKDREQATIVVTYSSNNTDVQNAIQYVDQIGGNLIVLAIGAADQNVLQQLTGNVVYSKNMTTDIIDQINSLLCTPTTRAPVLITTTAALTSSPVPTTKLTSSPAPTTTVFVTTQTPAPTTPLPDPCPDCSPKTSNILLLLEAFGAPLDSQKSLIENDLTATWNHFERTSIIGFDTMVKNLDPINFGDLQSRDEFIGIAQSLTAFTEQPTIVSAFNLALSRAQPLKTFGKMNSIIFTSGASAAEINAAMPNSKNLRAKGTVILVGLKLTDATGLDTLCDVLLKWDDFTDLKTISTQINQALNSQ